MQIIKTLINKPVSVIIVSSLVFIISMFMISLIPQELIPEFDFPTISVVTNYNGAGPEEIESSITEILEGVFLSISGVTEISSTSSENTSIVRIKFDWNRDLDAATNDIRDKIDLVRNRLPEQANSPVIFRLNLNTLIPVMRLTLSGLNMSNDELKEIAENQVVPYIEQIDGVASVNIFGGREQQVRVEVIQNRLEAYNITMNDVAQAISAQNVQISAGSINIDNQRILLRTAGEFSSLQEIEDVVITYKPILLTPAIALNGSTWSSLKTDLSNERSTRMIPVRIRDIANVILGFAEAETYSEINNTSALTLNVQRQSGSNAVEIAKLLRKQLPQLNSHLPNGINVEILYDTSRMTTNSIAQVIDSATSGLILIILILLIFLRNLKSAIIVSITMPLSIFTTIMLMYFFDLSLNLMSLTGLTLGVGMIVDSSIVIIENIYRYREKGVKPATAAYLGASEMIIAITASTLTTVAVFLPMVIFQKELQLVGVLFGDLSFTIVIALFSSLIFSITVVPVLAGTFLAINTPKQKSLKGIFYKINQVMEQILSWLDTKYSRSIEWSLNYRWIIILFSFGTLIFSIILLLSPIVGSELMPEMDEQTLSIGYTLPVDSTLDASVEIGQSFTRQLQKSLEAENSGKKVANFYILSVGGNSFNFSGSLNEGTLTIIMDDDFHKRPLSTNRIREIARNVFTYYPGVKFNFMAGGPGGGGSTFELDIVGNDQQQLTRVASDIVEILREEPKIKEPTSNLEAGIPETIILPDRDRAGAFGVALAQIGSEIRANVNGMTVSIYRAGGKESDIFLVLREEDRMSLKDIDRIYVNSRITGTRISLSNIVDLKEGISPVSIVRKNQTRQATVTANAGLRANGIAYPAGSVSEAAWQAINQKYVPEEGIILREGGDNKTFVAILPTLLMVVVISIILVYGIMASQFESLKDPFIIILSITTMPIGPIAIYAITQQPFSSFSIVGMIMLVGIVVNTGIILVDYINLLRKRGMPLREAVIETGRLRLRPILMTTLTTILGMIPMAIAQGDGTAMTKPIGITVVGGMISSSVMTLFLVPVLYYMFNQKNERKKIEKLEQEQNVLLQRHNQKMHKEIQQ